MEKEGRRETEGSRLYNLTSILSFGKGKRATARVAVRARRSGKGIVGPGTVEDDANGKKGHT